jgi:hypothetical protein
VWVIVDLLHVRQNRDLRRRREEQGVAVGRRLRGIGRRNRPARTDAIFDDEGLLEHLGKLLARNPGHDVGVSAGCKRHHHRHGLGRPICRLRRRGAGRERSKQGEAGQHMPAARGAGVIAGAAA